MKCYFHEEKDAVATCQNCGKSLCKECASKRNPCICDECFELKKLSAEDKRKQKRKNALIDTNKEFIMAILKGIICAVVLTLIFKGTGGDVPTVFSVMLFFVPFGWALITYLEQWMPIFFFSGITFLIFLIFKLAFSILLGIPCFLYQIIKYIISMVKLKQN